MMIGLVTVPFNEGPFEVVGDEPLVYTREVKSKNQKTLLTYLNIVIYGNYLGAHKIRKICDLPVIKLEEIENSGDVDNFGVVMLISIRVLAILCFGDLCFQAAI